VSDASHFQRLQAAVWQLPDAYGKIGSILDNIGDLVGEPQIDINLRIGCQEFRDDRRKVQPAERQRRADGEAAPRRLVFTLSQPFGFTQFAEQLTAALEIHLAGVGQRHLSRRSREQTNAEVIFKVGDLSAHRCQRRSKSTRGRGETAGLHDSDERRHRFEAIHFYSPIQRNSYFH
jgi:hypothetical protein